MNDHLKQFGCVEIGRDAYHLILDSAIAANADFFAFTGDSDPEDVLRLASPPGSVLD